MEVLASRHVKIVSEQHQTVQKIRPVSTLKFTDVASHRSQCRPTLNHICSGISGGLRQNVYRQHRWPNERVRLKRNTVSTTEIVQRRQTKEVVDLHCRRGCKSSLGKLCFKPRNVLLNLRPARRVTDILIGGPNSIEAKGDVGET